MSYSISSSSSPTLTVLHSPTNLLNINSSLNKSPGKIGRIDKPNRQAIALISDHGDPAATIGQEDAGGQNVYVRQIGESLAKLGWQVDMFTRKRYPDDAAIVQHSPYCRTIRLKAGPTIFIPRDRLFEHMPEFLASFLDFQTREGSHYPLIHTNYWMSAWVGLQLKKHSNIQIIHTYHSLGAVKYQTVSYRPEIATIRLEVEKKILEQGDCIVATSPQEEDVLRSLVSNQGTIKVIPCGTNLQQTHVMPKREARKELFQSELSELDWNIENPIALYVGRFDPRKGIETLVQSIAILKQQKRSDSLQLLIVGGSDPEQSDGEERARIEAVVCSLGLESQTHFVGQISHDRLPLYYRAADVCVVPSHYEPFGLVAIEAMGCGTPVVASDVGGLKFTVVPGETGWLVPPQDPHAFANAIERVLSDRLSGQTMSELATLRVQQNFTWTGAAAQLSDLYRRLLARSITHPRLEQSLAFTMSPIVPPRETTSHQAS
jgi:D-inositol-3-phosphate glycosyltransferase